MDATIPMTREYKLKDFDTILFDALRDPESAEIYLQDAWEDSTEEFLIALRKYVQANGGMARCADQANVSREALCRMLSENGNPELRSIRAALQTNGIRFSITRQPVLASA